MDTEEGKEEKDTVIDKIPEEKPVVISNEQVKQTVDKEQSHIVTKKPSGGSGNGVEETWTGIELVGLSPDSGEAETLCDEKTAVFSDERPCVNLKVDEKDDISASNGAGDGYKSDNEKESQSESEVNDEQLRNPVVCALPKNSLVADSMSGANGYKSDDEKESQSESETNDDRLRKPSPEGYSEDNENSEDDDDNEEDDGEEVNSADDDNEEDEGEEINSADDDEEDDGEEINSADDDNEEDDGEEINSADEVVKEHPQSCSGYSDEDYSNHSDEKFSNHSDEEYDKTEPVVNMEEDTEELKSPSHVPRRTGFWDHDDRFADISIQESREPKGNRKLWDKSEVERWQHDKYLEIEQGPKQQWEIDQLLQELDEQNQRRQPGGDGRHQKKFGDFLQDSNNRGQNYSHGNSQSDGQNYGRGNNKRGGYNQNRNQQRGGYRGEHGNYRNQAEEQKGDYRYRDDGENQGYNNRTDNYHDSRCRGGYDNNKMIQNRNQRGGYNKQRNYQDQADQNEKGDYSHRNDVQYDNYHNKEKVRNKNYSNQDDNSYDRQLKQNERKYDQRESEQRGDDRDRKNEKREERQVDEKDRRRRDEMREDDRNINERDSRRSDKRMVEERDRRADERRDKTLQNNEDIERFNKKIEDHKTQHQNSRRNERHDKQDEKNRDIIPKKKGGKGRGRGVTDENFKDTRRAEEFEKLNRRKRIEQLPPRLREKALEKAEKQEKDKRKERKLVQEENYEDAEEEAISPEDGVVRDKPKRYSSQRQKTGTSMLDIPGQISSQIPEDEEGRARYHEQLGFIQQYNQQLAARQPQNQDFVSNSNIKILEQQIIHLQSQLQQQLNLRPQQQQSLPNMMPTHPNMGMQMPNMVPGVEQQPEIYSNEGVYPINQTMLSSASGEGLPMLNPQINPMVLNQLMAAAGVQSQQAHEMGGGLYVPHPQSSQQPQMSDVEQQQQLRRLRPAAIPIKPPPGL